jgi:hypothetical protein
MLFDDNQRALFVTYNKGVVPSRIDLLNAYRYRFVGPATYDPVLATPTEAQTELNNGAVRLMLSVESIDNTSLTLLVECSRCCTIDALLSSWLHGLLKSLASKSHTLKTHHSIDVSHKIGDNRIVHGIFSTKRSIDFG